MLRTSARHWGHTLGGSGGPLPTRGACPPAPPPPPAAGASSRGSSFREQLPAGHPDRRPRVHLDPTVSAGPDGGSPHSCSGKAVSGPRNTAQVTPNRWEPPRGVRSPAQGLPRTPSHLPLCGAHTALGLEAAVCRVPSPQDAEGQVWPRPNLRQLPNLRPGRGRGRAGPGRTVGSTPSPALTLTAPPPQPGLAGGALCPPRARRGTLPAQRSPTPPRATPLRPREAAGRAEGQPGAGGEAWGASRRGWQGSPS